MAKIDTLVQDFLAQKKIAVVGGGPGGFSCAYQLARRGYKVTVFEAADKAGGMLRWGIPRYRLPATEVSRVWTDGHSGVPIKEKAVPGPDEDTVTIAIEAARNALASWPKNPGGCCAIPTVAADATKAGAPALPSRPSRR